MKEQGDDDGHSSPDYGGGPSTPRLEIEEGEATFAVSVEATTTTSKDPTEGATATTQEEEEEEPPLIDITEGATATTQEEEEEEPPVIHISCEFEDEERPPPGDYHNIIQEVDDVPGQQLHPQRQIETVAQLVQQEFALGQAAVAKVKNAVQRVAEQQQEPSSSSRSAKKRNRHTEEEEEEKEEEGAEEENDNGARKLRKLQRSASVRAAAAVKDGAAAERATPLLASPRSERDKKTKRSDSSRAQQTDTYTLHFQTGESHSAAAYKEAMHRHLHPNKRCYVERQDDGMMLFWCTHCTNKKYDKHNNFVRHFHEACEFVAGNGKWIHRHLMKKVASKFYEDYTYCLGTQRKLCDLPPAQLYSMLSDAYDAAKSSIPTREAEDFERILGFFCPQGPPPPPPPP